MLLPDAFTGPRDFLVATAAGTPYIAGAASFIRAPQEIESIRIEVPAAFRRTGIGSRLMGHIRGAAERRGDQRLSTWIDLATDLEAPKFLAAHSFERTNGLTTLEAETLPFCEYFDSMRLRLRSRGQIAQNARVVTMAQASRADVARLWATHIPAHPWLRTDIVEHSLKTGHFNDSPVLLMGERLAGFLLLSFDGARVKISAEVIAPEYRGGPGIILLTGAACDQVRARQTNIVTFDWRDDVKYTGNLSKRFGGRVLRRLERYSLELNALHQTCQETSSG